MLAPLRDPTPLEASAPLRLPALPALRRAKVQRRAHAMCTGAEYVLGIRVLPMTLPSFSLLLAHGSPFLLGGQPREGDVRNYLWFHSPHYVDSTCPHWERVKRDALAPFTRHLTSPWRKWFGLRPDFPRYAAALALAITDIRALTDFDFADVAGNYGRGGAPVASLHAQMLNSFSQAYPSWTREQIESTPLRVLFQLDRALAASRGKEVPDDDEEAQLAAHIRARQAALDAAKNSEPCRASDLQTPPRSSADHVSSEA